MTPDLKNDARQLLGDLIAGIGLLTRLPVQVNVTAAQARSGISVWCWPLVGVIVAALAAALTSAGLALGITAGAAAALFVATQIVITGAMHEDGLADSCDGLWGGWDSARRLAIMKDSAIGTYGVLALILSILVRWSALAALIEAGGLWGAALGTAALSRAPMAALMALLPNARDGGLSHSVGRPSGAATLACCGLALLLGLVTLGPSALPAVLAVGLITAGWGLLARAKIGGQTGDILGASQQLAEIGCLITLAALL